MAIAGSPISVHRHSRDLIFSWIYNPPRGFTPEDFIGKKIEEVYQPEDTARIRKTKEQVLATGVGTRGFTWFTLKGERYDVDYSIEPIRDSSGKVTGLTCALVDITECTRAEEALLLTTRHAEEVARELARSNRGPRAVRRRRQPRTAGAVARRHGLPGEGTTFFFTLPAADGGAG